MARVVHEAETVLGRFTLYALALRVYSTCMEAVMKWKNGIAAICRYLRCLKFRNTMLKLRESGRYPGLKDDATGETRYE